MAHKPKHEIKNEDTSKPIPPKEDPVVEIAKINRQGLIITVLITALLAPLALEYFEHKIDVTPTIAITETFTPLPSVTPIITLDFSPTPSMTETVTPSMTETATPSMTKTATPSMTETFTPLPTNAPNTPADIMNVILIPTWYNGKAPLLVNFIAKNSFITFANGTTSSCTSTRKTCSFLWIVYRDGQMIYGPAQGESVFPYIFEKKGKHTLSVSICHGQTCSSATADIEVK